jgi:CRP-like cAMP-binding protein
VFPNVFLSSIVSLLRSIRWNIVIHQDYSECDDYDFNDEAVKVELEQKIKIREVEHQITLLSKNRPATLDEDEPSFNPKMRGTVMVPSLGMVKDYNPPTYPKTNTQRQFLLSVLKDNFLFSELSEEEFAKLVNSMQKQTVKKDHTIIRQGDVGDFFYIVESGTVNFVLDNVGVVGTTKQGGAFGELALLYDSPRAASCIAASEVVNLWKVDQTTFRYLLASHSNQHHSQMKELLGKITLFKDLAPADVSRFTHSLTPVQWKLGARIVQKGEEGNVFYIIQKGQVKIHDIGLGGSKFEDQLLGPGGWFGERALLTGEPRAANVTALTEVTTLAMDRETFEEILGPLKSLMEREMRRTFLKGMPLFAKAKVSDEELTQLVDLMRETCYKKGEKLAESGKRYKKVLWIIRAGRLRVSSSKSDKIYNLKNGDHFGDKSVRGDPDHISSHTAVCEEDLTTWILMRKDIESVIGDITRLEGSSPLLESRKILLSDLTKRRVLGQGAFGKVWLVSHNETNKVYALKEIGKRKILESDQLSSVVREKELLGVLQHPFILNLDGAFQDVGKVYLLLPVVPGGELFSVLHSQKTRGRGLPDSSAAFYAACIIEALGHFHQRSIAYRDLKLENVLIDEEGYCKIVDLGFAKVIEDKTYTLVGTPEYLAPEIVMSKGHDKAADYWAFGVLTYELLVGRSPFFRPRSSQIDMFKRIVMVVYDVPEYVDPLAKSMIMKLLVRRQTKRLGNLANGFIDIKREGWFEASGVSQTAIRCKEATPPWKPELKDPFDTSNFDDFSAAEREDDLGAPLTEEEQAAFTGF